MEIFNLTSVGVQFDQTPALADINLQIHTGEQVAIVGPSGAGKSSLLSLLNGSLSPSSGEIWVLGRNLTQLKSRQRRPIQRQIGTIYQQLHLVENLRVIHNVNAGHLGRWSLLKAAWSLVWPLEVTTALAALQQVGIPEKLYARTDQLSGGQQQRVAIARVLVQNPAVILADEPISSLDPARSREILDLLCGLSQQTDKTLVMSLHSIELACEYCQRIIGLRQGQIMFDLPATEVTAELTATLYQLET